MAEEDVDKLKLFWEYFFKAETGTYEKSTWLDLFLAEFLLRVNEGCNPKELIKFCPISGVVSLIGCELLCGIHRVTSAINTQCTLPLPTLEPLPDVPEEDQTDRVAADTSDGAKEERGRSGLFTRANAQSSADILRKYLLSGVAWKCLVMLKALGVEGMSCCRQLSSVLIWLYGELGGAGAADGGSATNPYVAKVETSHQMHELFSNRIWSKQKLSGGQGSKTLAAAEKSPHIRSKKINQMKSETDTQSPRRKVAKASEESSESVGSAEDLQALNRSLSIKISTPEDDFQYFNSPITSLNEPPKDTFYPDHFYSPKKNKPKADDYITDKHKNILNSEISSFEFTLIITDLLKELCKAESSLSGSEGSQISVHCINFSLRNLCSLQFGSLPACSLNYSAPQVSIMKLSLTELLIVSLDKVLVRSDLCAKLINNGILPMLLRILEDVVYKSSSKFHKKTEKHITPQDIEEKLDKNESNNLLKFVFGIAYSITAFFYCLLTQCRTVDKLREFTDQFKLYGECLKGASLKECVELMMRLPEVQSEAVALVKKLIEGVGKLIWAMKLVRSEVIHSAACPRTRHKACRARVAAGLHHHHDLLGRASADVPLASTCCVSLLYATLATVAVDERVAAIHLLRNKVLRVMLNCGVCCCFSPGLLMENVVKLMLTHHASSALCLQLLEHTIYGELGASVLVQKVTDQLPCSVCEPTENTRDSTRKYYGQGVGGVERKSIISFLIHYNSLLQLDNHNNVLHATVSHLQRITPKCRTEMKYELLFSVIYPTFIVAKHRYIIRLEESSYFLTISCLNIFANLLNSVSFAEQFIQKGGLSYVLELVSIPEFSEQCCSILEIAITVEIFKLMRDHSDMAYSRDMNSLASVQMLIKSLIIATDKCYKIYKIKLPSEVFEELCNISREREALSVHTRRRDSEQFRVRKISTPKSIRITYAAAENTTQQNVDDYIEVLKNTCTFWKSCAALCLYSPMFRKYFVEESVFLDSYCLLKIVLKCLQQSDVGSAEIRVLIKIMEALLTVQFAVSDVTSERSKAATCDVLHSAFSNGNGAGVELRALCDALVRVATQAPSRNHTMPPISTAKLPPLTVSESGPLERCSSEETVSEPYASDRSDPRPDPGYEADVEVCVLEQSTPSKVKRGTTPTLNASLNHIDMVTEIEAECATYTSNGTVAHPELCSVVFDILTKIIQNVVSYSSSESCELQAQARRLASCGRGVCARLAAAAPAAAGHLEPLLRAAEPLLLADTAHTELQHSILELFHVLACQSISPRELAAVLRIASGAASVPPPPGHAPPPPGHAPPPPLPPPPPSTAGLRGVLAGLLRLAADERHDAPQALLTFPIIADPSIESKTVVKPGTAPGQQAEAVARKLREQHLQNEIVSCWSRHAVRAGVEGASWAPWLQGFAILVWLYRAPSEGVNESTAANRELAHIVSVGHASLMFELWMNVDTGCLTVRLCRPEAGSNRALSAGESSRAVPRDSWRCLAVSVRETLARRRALIQVTIYIDGLQFETISLPIPGILVRKVSPSNVLFGSSLPIGRAMSPGGPGGGGCGGGVWRASSLRVLRSASLDAYGALALAAAGHHADLFHTPLVDNMVPNYADLLTPDLLDSNLDWDQVFGGSARRRLAGQLLLSYGARAPLHFNLYHQTAAPILSGGVAAGASGVPEGVAATWAGAPSAGVRRGLATSLHTLAAPHLLHTLTHKVSEVTEDESCQALALALQLRASRHYGQTPPHVSHTVHTLQVIFSEACSSSVLSLRSADGETRVVLSERTNAAILQPELLLFSLDIHSKSCTWESESGESRSTHRGSLWTLALSAICCLLHEDNKRHAFNRYQLERVDFVEHFFLSVKELVLISGGAESGAGAGGAEGGALAALCAALLRGDGRTHAAALGQMLLLLHPASDTFVTHSRSDFYFLLTSEVADLNEFSLLNFMNKNKSLRTSKKKSSKHHASSSESKSSSVQTVTSSSVTSDTASIDSAHAMKELAQNQDAIDPTKEMKGLINMQIRDSRRHNASSSISETSEDTSHSAEEFVVQDGGGGDPALGEYVVVSAHDDVAPHTPTQEEDASLKPVEESGWALYEALVALFCDVLRQMTPQEAEATISVEVVAVLGNHRSGAVRAAVMRAAAALRHVLRPAPRPLHLAHQISLYECTRELAEACAALVTQLDCSLQDQAREEVWLGVTEESLQLSPPLLAVLPRSLHDTRLALDIIALLKLIVDKASLKQISELAIAETCARTAREMSRVTSRDDRDRLVVALSDVTRAIASKAVMSQHHMQTLLEVHYLLQYIELSDDDLESEGSWFVSRQLQALLYDATLTCLDERQHAQTTKRDNYFTTVLSSAVSLTSDTVSRSELCSRYRATVSRAVAFVVERRDSPAVPDELALLRRLMDTLIHAWSPGGRGGGSGGGGGRWAELGGLLSGLCRWALSPRRAALAAQPAALAALAAAPHLPPLDDPHQLAIYVLTSVGRAHEAGSLALAITDWARGWALALLGGAERPAAAALPAAAQRLAARDQRAAAAHRDAARHHVHRAVSRWESLSRTVCEGAMRWTRAAVEAQNSARKRFLAAVRAQHARRAAAAAACHHTAHCYTHERGVFHEPWTYPVSWALDALEGPDRSRRRLRRAHLRLPPRFLQPSHRYKTELAARYDARRAAALGGAGAGAGGAGRRGARLSAGERAVYTARVICVTVANEAPGELLLTDRAIHFVPDEVSSDPEAETPTRRRPGPAPCLDPVPPQTWPLDSITGVSTRRWCLRERALELRAEAGRALLAFPSAAERAACRAHLARLAAPASPLARALARSEQDMLTEATTLWRQGTITNWDYLMRLNDLAGRTYNDLMQYPIIPFVIADYTSKILDLTDYKSFRDLTKPMAIQNKNREQHYINTYNDLKAAQQSGSSSSPPHHYASLYSNSGAVLHYLVRLPPFTQLFLNYQDNNFDMPDRTFHSMATTWRLITNDSPTDVKELIPELFYLPELFYNNEGLSLGVRQCGAGVDLVELPPWAAGDARLFTLLQRQALEAAPVSAALHAWIDLVFGYKQLGHEARKALNVFPACTYYGFDPSSLSDEVERRAAEAMVRTYGQAPRVLFPRPHPARADYLPPPQPSPCEVSAWSGVVGASWGVYCGSPARPAPAPLARRALLAARLQPLPAPRAVAALHLHHLLHIGHGTGMPGATSPLSALGAAGGVGVAGAGPAGVATVVSWGHSDGVCRARRRVPPRDVAVYALLPAPIAPDHDITCMATSCLVPGCPIIVGTRCGWVGALVSPPAEGPAPEPGSAPSPAPGPAFQPRSVPLQGHSDAIVDIQVCPEQGLIVTASRDGLILLWDLHELSYIRTLPNRDMLPVSHVAVSATLADVASVHDLSAPRPPSGPPAPPTAPPTADNSCSDSYEQDRDKYASLIRVHTVNGSFVGHVKVAEEVTSVCYSNAPEGVSVNVVVAGLAGGGAALYSSWDLRPVAALAPVNTTPVISICYSVCNEVLFMCHSDGSVLAWESGGGGAGNGGGGAGSGGGRGQPARILPAASLL